MYHYLLNISEVSVEGEEGVRGFHTEPESKSGPIRLRSSSSTPRHPLPEFPISSIVPVTPVKPLKIYFFVV